MRSCYGKFFAAAWLMSAPLWAQDNSQNEEAEPAQQEEAEAQSPAPAEAQANVQPLERKKLYFVGPKLRAARQLGPSVGTPQSIIPQPFVAVGSVAVPPPAEVPVGDGAAALDAPVSGQEAGQGLDVGAAPGAETPELPGSDGTTPTPDAELADQDLPFQEGALERIDPSGLPVGGVGQGLETVWEGYSRTDVEEFLGRLAQPSFSPSLTRLAAEIAASRFVLPAPENDADIVRMLEARLSVFEVTANLEAYTALLRSLPTDTDWSALSRQVAKAHMLRGELPDACAVADRERAYDSDPYWVRLAVFCLAAAGNRTGVDFQLGILEETTELDATFYQLLDQVLVEAEQLPGAVLPEPITLGTPLATDVLTVSMARLARVRIPDVDAENASPLSIPLLLQNPSLERAPQAKLMSYLLARGIADGDTAARFARSVVLLDGEAEAALVPPAATESDDSAAEPGEADAGEEGSAIVDESLLQTTLLALAADGQNPSRATEAVKLLWERDPKGGEQLTLSAPLATIIAGWQAENVTPEIAALAARASLAAQDRASFNRWVRMLRISVAGEDAAKDAALLHIWPFIELNGPADADSKFDLWWRAQTEHEGKFRQANLLYAVAEGLGRPVSDTAWHEAAGGPAAFEGVAISPALWRQFQASVSAGDPLATLTNVYHLFGEIRPSDVPATFAAALVAGLRQVGFTEAAEAIAMEILISQGL